MGKKIGALSLISALGLSGVALGFLFFAVMLWPATSLLLLLTWVMRAVLFVAGCACMWFGFLVFRSL